ncbi:MAG: uncharacterized protein KVP18_005163 [Porospora cf. gigantea A]|uniref:uncharacterized protein n=1 Tax=Porospora cf. gigantea A TaxID=2853593 RepID=UPI00355A6B24|nr:MAG: hypothetical protein KVP18_005163 [Porospora cf. gigantea A]
MRSARSVVASFNPSLFIINACSLDVSNQLGSGLSGRVLLGRFKKDSTLPLQLPDFKSNLYAVKLHDERPAPSVKLYNVPRQDQKVIVREKCCFEVLDEYKDSDKEIKELDRMKKTLSSFPSVVVECRIRRLQKRCSSVAPLVWACTGLLNHHYPYAMTAQPYYEEGTLRQLMKEATSMSTWQRGLYTITLLRDVGEALSYLHRDIAVIHTDVRPANVALTRKGPNGMPQKMVLLDLDNAFVSTGSSSRKPGRAGTEEYQAPECLLSRGCVEASDDWALGAVALTLLTGLHFPGCFAKDAARLERLPFVKSTMNDIWSGLIGLLVPNPERRATSADITSEKLGEVTRERPE